MRGRMTTARGRVWHGKGEGERGSTEAFAVCLNVCS